MTYGGVPYRAARLLAIAAVLASCGSSDRKSGDDLAGEVEAAVQQYFDSQNLGWTVGSVSCGDMPVVEEGSTATCDVDIDQEQIDDLEVEVTMQDETGGFDWHASGVLTQ